MNTNSSDTDEFDKVARFCVALCEDILSTSADDIMLEVENNFGSRQALALEFDRIFQNVRDRSADNHGNFDCSEEGLPSASAEIETPSATGVVNLEGESRAGQENVKLAYSISSIEDAESSDGLYRFLQGCGSKASGICVNLRRVSGASIATVGRARVYQFGDALILGDTEFERPIQIDVHRPLFYMIRILFAMQVQVPLENVIWPAGLFGVDRSVEKECADVFMRPVSWSDIKDHYHLRRLAMASTNSLSMSSTGIYCVDERKAMASTFERITERVSEVEACQEPSKVREELRRLVNHSVELLFCA